MPGVIANPRAAETAALVLHYEGEKKMKWRRGSRGDVTRITKKKTL
jgi:hypothetical protein